MAAIATKYLELQAAAVSDNYTWAIRESPRADDAWVRGLMIEATDSLLPLFNAGVEKIFLAGYELPLRPHSTAQLVSDLQSTYLSAQEKVRVCS